MVENILELLNKLYPITIIKVEAVTDEMFRCTSEKGTYFARITNYKNMDEQMEEVKYTDFLYKEGLGVSPTITSIQGKVVEKVTLNNNEVLTVLYQAAPGVHLPRNQWNAEIFNKLGQQIGRLHRISQKFEDVHQVKHINDWHDNEEYAFLKYIPKEERSIREVVQEALSTIKKIPKNRSNYGLLHGDLWLENILVDRDSNITMVDFQDCEKHFYIYDIVVPIYSALEYSFVGGSNIAEYEQAITKAIIKGYLEENELPNEMLEMFPQFIKLKEIFDYSLMHMYWDKEKLTEEQVRIMNLYRMRLERNHSNFTI
ncbi:Ser/Thr protein kinase RdoA (MazF antagonist) [Gracilibacillus halotolerans]|uniref:Ser/Thr protein kinase RdoA (MazF antagonist) n=1 Tax=Gracilibacillus halotolerans TaxID=74386 RepID=A0A841RKH7_9BACI|nr:phosphotransferase [Gracilibacillus halotolerans]MBB6512133.1 Ser/Thr protein kinase RdoA (MazF antagonist) [Gracilibacillus halotolerans]